VPQPSDRAFNDTAAHIGSTLGHLVGMQAQTPHTAYVGLWTRLEGFRGDDLSTLLLDRSVVRMALMRGTIHLVTEADACGLRPLVQPVMDRVQKSQFGKRLAGVDLGEVLAMGRAFVDEQPRTFKALGDHLLTRWPHRDRFGLEQAVRTGVPLVQVPPRGLWSRGGAPAVVPAETWLHGVRAEPLSMPGLVRRYLAAYGPASVQDAQTFTGVTGLRAVFEELRPELLAFRDEEGGELFDLPDAPRPTARTKTPARFLPEFDNILLSHARRERILPEGTMSLLSLGNGLKPAFLVDGFVAGTWKLTTRGRTARLEVRPFERPSRVQRGELEEEGRRLLGFAARGAARTEVSLVV